MTELLDWSGTIIEKYTYDAFGSPTVRDRWGNVRGNVSWYGNRFMFAGREWFANLRVYDYRNRLYAPSLGRFLQIDPIGFDAGDANLFRYCGGDPVNGSDPFGLEEDYDGRIIVTADPIGRNPFDDGGPFELWNRDPLADYFDRSSNYEVGLRESSGSQPLLPVPTLPAISLPALPPLIPIFDLRTERNIATLLPFMQATAREHVNRVRHTGLDMRIINGARTFAEQDALYAQGRTTPGQIVTNARGGESNHNFGTAYDVGFFNGGTYIDEGLEYDVAGRIGMELGLEWGGTWTGNLVDRPHFQHPGGH